MSVLTLRESFSISGTAISPTSVVLSNSANTYGVKRDDTDAVVVAAGIAMVETETGSGIYTHSFTQPAADLTYTYWVKWIYEGETFYDEHTVVGTVPDGIISVRNTDKYLNWIKAEFAPLTLATPDATIEHCLENAIRYWNTHSGHKTMTMVAYSTGDVRVQLPTSFKSVVTVYPSNSTTWIWNGHPLWSLLGITVLDSITSDMIILSEAFKDYRIYVGADFRWTWVRSDDPDNVGGYLYAKNAPAGSSGLAVVGTRRITSVEDIIDEYMLDWILQYTKALVTMIEGNTLRKAGIVDFKNDGGDLVGEGNVEKIRLQQKLSVDSRWVSMARRC